ncbi:MAG: hypothetical protein ACREKL_03905, partial [Chthoniobacterales bacterium]
GLRTRVDGNELRLDLFFDETWQDRLAKTAPEVVVAEGASGKPHPLTWERLQPGHYQAKTLLTPGTWIRGAVQVGAYTLPFGPVTAVTNPEWSLDRERVRELEAVSRVSGGVERVDLSGIWQAPRRQEYRDIRPWLLVALLIVFLADVLVTRVGWRMPELALPRFGKIPRIKVRVPGAAKKQAAAKPVAPPVPATIASKPPAESPDSETRGSRFRRAKRGGK